MGATYVTARAVSGVVNVVSAVAIVIANKIVLYSFGFGFPITLTLCHVLVTWLGMGLLQACGVYQAKGLPLNKCAMLAISHVSGIVLNNISLHLNTVGFYQTSKILLTPTVAAIEVCVYRASISTRAVLAITLLLPGVALASISDPQVTSNTLGICVAAGTVFSAALNLVWTGTVQIQEDITANQLLYAISPASFILLALLVPVIEPLGIVAPTSQSVLGYHWTLGAMLWIAVSSCLGLVVSQSQCMLIGATSGTTYSVISHTKTLLVVLMGWQLFGDVMTGQKVAGLCLAMVGLMAYSSCSVKSVRTEEPHQHVPNPGSCPLLPKQNIEDDSRMPVVMDASETCHES